MLGDLEKVQIRISGPSEAVEQIRTKLEETLRDWITSRSGPYENNWDPGVRSYLIVRPLEK